MNRPASPTPRRRARATLAHLPESDQKEAKVFGPYRDRDKWRLVVFDGQGRKSVIADSESEAHRLKTELDRAILQRRDLTIGELLPEFETYLSTERGSVTASVRRRALERFMGGHTIGGLTPKRAADLYAAESERVTIRGKQSSAAAHRTYLSEAKRFFRWAISRGYATSNPFADVRPVGRVAVGKPQLRIEEARRFVAVAMEAAQKGDKLAVAALLALMLGARASEVLQRRIRDLDDGSAVLWIPFGKTKNAKRRLAVPCVLRPLLAKLAEGRSGDAPLFATPTKPMTCYTDAGLWLRVQRLCTLAGVPRVCTHSLRGLHATLSVSAGMSSEHVAASLGHASFAITAKHYADGSAIADRNTAEVTGALLGQKPAISDLIRGLSSVEREELRAALRGLP